jgi:hypothetical protein
VFTVLIEQAIRLTDVAFQSRQDFHNMRLRQRAAMENDLIPVGKFMPIGSRDAGRLHVVDYFHRVAVPDRIVAPFASWLKGANWAWMGGSAAHDTYKCYNKP